MTESTEALSGNEQQQLRADVYQLIAALLRATPSPELLQFLSELDLDADQDGDIIRAWHALKLSASTVAADQLEDEYFKLFIGLGHGEVIPYTSWYLTGSLMDQPLALLRQDLLQLGFSREEDVKEPEDHLAALCEVMAYLLLEGRSSEQMSFYNRHLDTWVDKFFADLAKAPSSSFYTAVAALGQSFFKLEQATFGALTLETDVTQA
ncbi:TorD/DmsD family molecular chaperone [Ferrimonas lipolytica]|uniref:Molecular chaperone TorD family protein n=1 Tax=Ferrimonas lipolytica TaxID=2724191 RepID=A0A6H1UFX4_9GAMM|nr:molecular chaperone TorD family protein [Ferrimonas lipolytica]QIZ78005.1 molecular chaperone TorD family protein [Ferrimonas lipolytica]